MRQCEKMMLQAVNAGRAKTIGNTSVYILFGRYLYVSLFGNDIFCKDLKTGAVSYSCAGWNSPTTASRLRALGLACCIRRGRLVDASGAPVPCRLS